MMLSAGLHFQALIAGSCVSLLLPVGKGLCNYRKEPKETTLTVRENAQTERRCIEDKTPGDRVIGYLSLWP